MLCVVLVCSAGFSGDGAFGISMSEMTSCNREEWPNITMIIFRNLGDQIFAYEYYNNWNETINIIQFTSKIFLTMAMAAIGLSTNLKDIKSMGYKPFLVGFIAAITVVLVSIISMQAFLKIII